MEKKITIYHGSPKIIERPVFGFGNQYNDYGQGFYCTQEIELAKEWACAEQVDGFANEYSIGIDGLSVLDLSNSTYSILNWLAILLDNRVFKVTGTAARNGKQYILETFLPEYKSYDLIKGYRADDSYFAFASAFINNAISLVQLESALYYGNLGEQIVLKSERAFGHLEYLNTHLSEGTIYYPKRLGRDSEARQAYLRSLETEHGVDDIYLVDIIRGRWTNDDSRIQRIVFR